MNRQQCTNNAYMYTCTLLYHVHVYTCTHGLHSSLYVHMDCLESESTSQKQPRGGHVKGENLWCSYSWYSDQAHMHNLTQRTLVCQALFLAASILLAILVYKVNKNFLFPFLNTLKHFFKGANSWPLTRAISGSLANADS